MTAAATEIAATSGPAPRLYNLHPLLAGPIRRWPEHLPRIAAMGFDWLHVNAFWRPGASGSIYAVADPSELHPLVRGDAAGSAEDLTAEFLAAARAHGLKVMLDLIVPHAAHDSLLAQEHPEWFRWQDGALVAPVLANPNDPRRPRVMADLAELDLDHPERQPHQIAHFAAFARRCLELGAAGFRCSSAYKVPPAFWRGLIDAVRASHPDCLFLAAALGCPFELVRGLEGCGFDLIFESSRWWDFHAPWFLDQREALQRIAPTVAFPEDHNTPRLVESFAVATPEEIARLYRARYLFAAAAAPGVLTAMGFEYAFPQRLDPVTTRPEDWQAQLAARQVDLTGFIAEANAFKAASPVLATPGTLRRVTAPNGRVVGLLRLDAGHPLAARAAALTVINPDLSRPDGIDFGPLLTATGGRIERFADVTPAVPPLPFLAGTPLTLEPLGVRVFTGEAEETARQAPAAELSAERLERLAAERVAIERVTPELDGGRFPAKRIVGDVLTVEADILVDGHDRLAAVVKYRTQDEESWTEVPMRPTGNDRWAGSFPLVRNTRYLFTVEAWRDPYATWRVEIGKKHAAGLSIGLELIEGRAILERAAGLATGKEAEVIRGIVARLAERPDDHGRQLAVLLGQEVAALMADAGERANRSRYGRVLEVVVDRTAAGFAAWYELFPRSMSDDPERHGTFADVIDKLAYVRDMGFDVLYFPPIHPIGRKNRKGRNNSLTAGPDDPGSPYAIGAAEGGHNELHPELGGLDGFHRLVAAAAAHGLEIALDFAIQASPDHPWIREHPEWFDWRPDGTIKYAENPPKKYEDIVHVEFYDGALPSVWYELRDSLLYWIGQGVKTFRVDNPHTKPLPFWEWVIREVQDRHPDAIFLSEAFTRPKLMNRLAKLGFTQSYSYFTWRNSKAELVDYLTELTVEEAKEHMRPNFFVNTPDINPTFLQTSGRPGFRIRAALAATLSPLWGVYSGFELCEATPIPGREEYLDSEKYEIRAWDWERMGHIREDITRLNRIRRENPAMWDFTNLEFLNAGNDQVVVYAKLTEACDNAILVAVNLDPAHAQGTQFEVPLWRFGLDDAAGIAVEDLLTGSRFAWTGKIQHVRLDPQHNPYAIWRLIPPGLPS
ncbi:MAG: maltotransferase domain-containing protein [Geminicoccaceae bacterium]